MRGAKVAGVKVAVLHFAEDFPAHELDARGVVGDLLAHSAHLLAHFHCVVTQMADLLPGFLHLLLQGQQRLQLAAQFGQACFEAGQPGLAFLAVLGELMAEGADGGHRVEEGGHVLAPGLVGLGRERTHGADARLHPRPHHEPDRTQQEAGIGVPDGERAWMANTEVFTREAAAVACRERSAVVRVRASVNDVK